MGLGLGGESEIEASPARRVVGGPQAAAMRSNDRAADPKSHAGAVNLGRKEGIKDLVRVLMGESHAVIADRHLKVVMIHSLRFDGELTRPYTVLHRIDAIDHEVHQHLLQLHTVCDELGKVRSQLYPD